MAEGSDFVINELVVNTLKPLGIPIVYLRYETDQKATAYCLFSIYNDEETDFADDTNDSETYYVQVSFWYDHPEDFAKVAQIRKLMKDAGFHYDGANDLFNENSFGKNIDFIYINYL